MNTFSKNIKITSPKNQLYLFGYKTYFNFFIKLFEKKKLPNSIIFSGAKGLGKSTFIYHFINYLLSINENCRYSINDFSINGVFDRVSKKAFDSGAISLKVTGAGGGGHLFVYAEPKKHKNLESNLKKLGVTRVHFSYHNAGATVFLYPKKYFHQIVFFYFVLAY